MSMGVAAVSAKLHLINSFLSLNLAFYNPTSHFKVFVKNNFKIFSEFNQIKILQGGIASIGKVYLLD